MEDRGSRRRSKHAAKLDAVSVDDPRNAIQVCQRNRGTVFEEQMVSGNGKPVKEPPLSAIKLCKDECNMKNKEKRRRKKCVSATGDPISSSPPSAVDDLGVEECERAGRLESSHSTVKDKKRRLRPSDEGAEIAEDGNMGKKSKKKGHFTTVDHHSQGDFMKVSQEDVMFANNMFVEMPSTEMSSGRKKNKRNKGHGREAIDSPSQDVLVNRESNSYTMDCGKKINKKDEDAQTQVKDFPYEEPVVFSFLEDVRPDTGQCGIIQGKRFSKEEDEIVRAAVYRYPEENKLGKEGFRKLLNRRKNPQVKVGCWNEIAASIPWRLPVSVRQRAEKLFLSAKGHKWTPEQIETVQRHVKEHGKQWASIADHLGVSGVQVYRAWTRYKNPNYQSGFWNQEECQHVFDLVHNDLRRAAFIEKNDRCGMARENISWTAISDEMSTRNMFSICKKWYRSLSSSMVVQGLWSDVDDYHLVAKLLKLDACCVEDVDWDNLLSNRSGGLCRKRWFEMARHIGGKVERSFMEQLELLSTRYRMDMLEYRKIALARTS